MNEKELKTLDTEGAVTEENPFADVANQVQEMVTAISEIINKYPTLAKKNFGLYYQHGRLGYMDLDMFAEKIKIAEKQKDIDKSEN